MIVQTSYGTVRSVCVPEEHCRRDSVRTNLLIEFRALNWPSWLSTMTMGIRFRDAEERMRQDRVLSLSESPKHGPIVLWVFEHGFQCQKIVQTPFWGALACRILPISWCYGIEIAAVALWKRKHYGEKKCAICLSAVTNAVASLAQVQQRNHGTICFIFVSNNTHA